MNSNTEIPDQLPPEIVIYIIEKEKEAILNAIDGQNCGGKVVMLVDLHCLDSEVEGIAWLPALADADQCRLYAANKGITLDDWGMKNTIPIVIFGRNCFGEAFLTCSPSEAGDD